MLAVAASPALVVPGSAAAPVSTTPIVQERDGDDDRKDGDSGSKKVADKEARAGYRVPKGVLFNHPFRKPHVIKTRMKQAIRHVHKGEKIRIMTWNFQANDLTRVLVDAHKRGVSVRLIMSRQLANAQSAGGSYNVLRRALSRGDGNRPAELKSWAKTCSHSCRGTSGAMHSKFIVLSQSGKSEKIVMQGSANLTSAAAINQWNDWYTTVGDDKTWAGYMKVFKQASKDRPVRAYQFRSGNILNWFAPRGGKPDLVMKLLKKVRCDGARDAGINGHTAIRVASSVFQNDRGLRIARRLRTLQGNGCNIRVVFTLMTNKIRNAIRGVPTRQLAYDHDGDGAFDDYLHMKSMSISGHVGRKRDARIVFNGSANWSTIGVISDEQGMIIKSDGKERRYGRWISSLYNQAPRGIRPAPSYYRARGLQNPYAELELELGLK